MSDLLLKSILSLFKNRPKPVLHYLERHFGCIPRKFPIVEIKFPHYRQACVHMAIQKYIGDNQRRAVTIGMITTDSDLKLNDLMHPDSFIQQTEGPIQYSEIALPDGSSLSFAERALYLVRGEGGRFAVFVHCPDYSDHMFVEVMSKERQTAEAFVSVLKQMADANSIFKRRTISIREHDRREFSVVFQTVPTVRRNQLILPDNIIEEIERHTSTFSEYREVLVARRRHLKRGLLLYGPPGTGKSLTIMYLISKMAERTTILLSGNNVRHLEDACELARSLQPATVVLDDVDLVAEERTRRNSNPLLFELLNQMDGISDDADVLFLLSTNRPEILEPALSARPGRVDQAILVPLPDKSCRAQLFDLYGEGLPLSIHDQQRFVDMTDGASAAFIRELFRKATLYALEEDAESSVEDRHFEKALRTATCSNLLIGKLLGSQFADDADGRETHRTA